MSGTAFASGIETAGVPVNEVVACGGRGGEDVMRRLKRIQLAAIATAR